MNVCLELAGSRRLAAIYGESAGANLSLAAAVALRDRGAALPDQFGPAVAVGRSDLLGRHLPHAGVSRSRPGNSRSARLRSRLCRAGTRPAPEASPLFADLAGAASRAHPGRQPRDPSVRLVPARGSASPLRSRRRVQCLGRVVARLAATTPRPRSQPGPRRPCRLPYELRRSALPARPPGLSERALDSPCNRLGAERLVYGEEPHPRRNSSCGGSRSTAVYSSSRPEC